MGITGGIIVYATSWFLLLLLILPRGVPTQIESGEIEPGTPGGAPVYLPIARKVMWTTLAAFVPFGLVWANQHYGVLTLDDFSFLYPKSFFEPPR